MSACKRWQEPLVDHALGEPASAELLAHLASCQGCSGALESLRDRAGKIDGAVRGVMAVEPPPQLERRILSATSPQPTPAVWRWRAAVAVLVAAAAALVVRYDGGRRQAQDRQQLLESAAALSEWRSPTAGLLVSPSQMRLGDVSPLGKSFFEIKPVAELSGQEKKKP